MCGTSCCGSEAAVMSLCERSESVRCQTVLIRLK